MNPIDTRSLIASRAFSAGLSIDDPLLDRLEAYLRLLAHWNTRINLTGFSLEQPEAGAIDRLLIEPLLLAGLLKYPVDVWFDLGSGGGSPAIPLQLYRPAGILVLVESKGRKVAFLREVSRELELDHVEVEMTRIESVATSHRLAGAADLVTIRAVTPSAGVIASIRTLLRIGGNVAMIGATSSECPIGLQVVPPVEFTSLQVRLFTKLRV